jgi:phospholipase/lecithinase/hemolysin
MVDDGTYETITKSKPMKTKTCSKMQSPTTRLPWRLNHHASAILSAAILMLAAVVVHADFSPFSRVFVFGDSLSDTGNFHAMTGGYPPPPYADGRFSNGKLWVEYAADALHMVILPGDNYAVAGATTGRFNVNNGTGGLTFPGLQHQIDSFQAHHAPQDAKDALFVVWAGANDFFAGLATGTPPETLISNGVYHTALAIVRLKQSGAQHILVLNVPDLGVTPFARSSGAGAAITQLGAAYNAVLAGTLDTMAANGIPTIRADSFATLDAMATRPDEFGFTNVTQPFLATGGNAAEFLFWDSVHPTTLGHAVLAQEALHSLLDYFSPREGNGAPDAGINALRGLVHARAGR